MARAWLFLLLAACSIGDDTLEGSRGACASGGVFETCDDVARTPEDACMRLVECGAIPLQLPEDYQFDYDNCVRGIQSASAGTVRLITSCIATSKCDALVPNNPNNPNPNEIPCLHFGAQ